MAAFAGGGVVIIEFAHHILVNHYHFPHQTVDICIVTLSAALLCTLTWRWFRGVKRKRRFKAEIILIPLIAVIAVYLNVRFIVNMGKAGYFEVVKNDNTIEMRSGNSIAIMYFENNTGDPDLDHWRKGLSEILITDLAQSKYIKVLSGDRMYSILDRLDQLEADTYSSEVLDRVASLGGVRTILLGNYIKAGDLFRINVTLQEAGTGKILGSERVQGEGEKSILENMVDDLTGRLKDYFNLAEEQITHDIDSDIFEITTSSPEAYKYYNEGVRYFRMADYREAARFFERAVSVDTNFALAFGRLASSYDQLGRDTLAQEFYQRAFDLRDRVSERERLRIERSVEGLTKLLELYPDDIYAHYALAFIDVRCEEWDKAIEHAEIAIENKKERIQTYQFLSHAYRGKGLYDKGREILEFFRDNVLDNASIHFYLCQNHICEGKFELALSEVNKALSLDPTITRFFRVRIEIFQSQGDYDRAEKEALRLLDLEDYTGQHQGYQALSSLCLLQGRFEKARQLLKQSLELYDRYGEEIIVSHVHLALAELYLILLCRSENG